VLTIAEVPEYIRRSAKLLTEEERRDIVDYLAANPKAGDIMEGTGGVRKLRWGRQGRGKSGGVRVIYYVHSELMPLYLLTLFAKNERANLTKAERNELAGLVDILVSAWLEK
jgi:hypothetical protein